MDEELGGGAAWAGVRQAKKLADTRYNNYIPNIKTPVGYKNYYGLTSNIGPRDEGEAQGGGDNRPEIEFDEWREIMRNNTAYQCTKTRYADLLGWEKGSKGVWALEDPTEEQYAKLRSWPRAKNQTEFNGYLKKLGATHYDDFESHPHYLALMNKVNGMLDFRINFRSYPYLLKTLLIAFPSQVQKELPTPLKTLLHLKYSRSDNDHDGDDEPDQGSHHSIDLGDPTSTTVPRDINRKYSRSDNDHDSHDEPDSGTHHSIDLGNPTSTTVPREVTKKLPRKDNDHDIDNEEDSGSHHSIDLGNPASTAVPREVTKKHRRDDKDHDIDDEQDSGTHHSVDYGAKTTFRA
ncbi:MAG: hypothetical protein Q9227_002888 [Pyrenula ochraceoflavens]